MKTKRAKINAEIRKLTGRKVKSLRRQGTLPANVFGKKIKSQSLSLNLQDFQKLYQQVGQTGLLDLDIKREKTPRTCLISNVHINPVTDLPLHADFHQVDLTEKVTAHVPVEFIGESPAVKEKGAILITLFDEIEVEALPANLPEKITVDIKGLKEFNDSILAKELNVDRDKVALQIGDKEAVVMVQEPKEEEEAPQPQAQAEEGEKPAKEGEEPAKEGEEKEAEAKPEEKQADKKEEAPKEEKK